MDPDADADANADGDAGATDRRRRRLLAALGGGAVGGLAGLAGCASRSGPGGGPDATPEGTTGDGGGDPEVETPDASNVELPVPREELIRGAPKDAIPAITDPAFGPDWSGNDFSLRDDELVIGVAREDGARAYPISVLDWHEVVNDDFGGPLLVTYCPLCGSAMTAVRRVKGQETVFGVSGFLFKSDLVMYDELTNTLWSQILAQAINSDAGLVGERLELVPSTITTWGQWRADNPDTQVLLPPPESGTITGAPPRNYDRYPYGDYEGSRQIGIGYSSFEDDRLHPKAEVIGVATDTASKAYPFDQVVEAGVINDTVGELPVVVAAGPEETLSAFVRRVDGEVLEFAPDGEDRMRAGGSTWTRTTGEAVSGPLEGTRLDQATGVSTQFWFAWLEFHPETTVYGIDDGGGGS